MDTLALILVLALAAASVPLSSSPPLPRLADCLGALSKGEMNTSNGADGIGVHLSPQDSVRPAPLHRSRQ
ncbi:hypothetical protein OHT59_04500 [Streptomyces sp. NBC_00243]|uniref:hypothetical protein n=1 Tax=Streptomyces sp. NBC_00243 TaxID=2975688 RepID=UPI002DD7B24D|nr:hypothetical protein [Streptomyces sp. NBC_00243]WRZ17797.1 hypothetical protein OHT59_04500 [Streptomyces sp. NBC_00243]